MAHQPKTQDNQKVFQSTLEKFSSFAGGVDNVSSSSNMSDMYENMTKLFDVFTQGALKEQGANSEILLRTVYRCLDRDFLKIVQDSDVVEKIAEILKNKQASINPAEADKALVSETTKKVVTKTLDPNTCDPMSVVLDFTDELQTAILQVKINLSREYERRKLEHARSIEGQQEDLDRLNEEFQQQNDIMVNVLDEMSKDQTVQKDADLKFLEKLLVKFDEISDDGYFKKGTDRIKTGIGQIEKSLSRVKFRPNKVLKDIRSTTIQRREDISTPGKKDNPQVSEKKKPSPSPSLKNKGGKSDSGKQKTAWKPDVRKTHRPIEKQEQEKQKEALVKPLVPPSIQQGDEWSKKDDDFGKPEQQQVSQSGISDGDVKAHDETKTTEEDFKEENPVPSPPSSQSQSQSPSTVPQQNVPSRKIWKKPGFQVLKKDLFKSRWNVQTTTPDVLKPSNKLIFKPSAWGYGIKPSITKMKSHVVTKKSRPNPIKVVKKKKTPIVSNIIPSSEEKEGKKISTRKSPWFGIKKLLRVIHQWKPGNTIPGKNPVKAKTLPSSMKPEASTITTKGTKLGGKPSGKTCTCPICGNVHQHGNNSVPQNEEKEGENQNGLSNEGVSNALGVMGNNIIRMVRDRKFRRNFEINYTSIQKRMADEMHEADKDEEATHDNFRKTKDGIRKLKQTKVTGNPLTQMLFSSTTFNLLWIAVGGLIILTLLRKGWQMWKNAYMPKVKSDPVTFTVFGFKIPVAGEIVDAFTGIKNFILTGLPNWWSRVSTTCGNLYEQLFGKKGCLRDFEQIKATALRLFTAWVVGQTKKAVGIVADWLAPIVSLVPYAGPILSFLCKLIPEVYAFITNRLMKEWANGQAEAERYEKGAKGVSRMKKKGATRKMKMLVSSLLKASNKIKPIAPPSAIPQMQTPNKVVHKVRKPMAIMRNVAIQNYRSGEGSAFDTNAKKADEKSREDWGGYNYDKDTRKFAGFTIGKRQQEGSAEHTRVTNAILNQDRVMEGKSTFEKLMILSQEPYTPEKRERAKKIFEPEYLKLVKYAAFLGRALERKYNSLGEQIIYVPGRGWNPVFRITQNQLVTRLPFEPYSDMVGSPIPYGQEAEPEQKLDGDGYGRGYMPFKWKWKGNVIVRDPQEWELRRVVGAIQQWQNLYELVSGPSRWWSGNTVPPDKLIDIVLGNISGAVSESSMKNVVHGSDDWRLSRQFMASWGSITNPYFQNPMSSQDSDYDMAKGLFPTYYMTLQKGGLTQEGLKFGNIIASATKAYTDENERGILEQTKELGLEEASTDELMAEANLWRRKFTINQSMTGFNEHRDTFASVHRTDDNTGMTKIVSVLNSGQVMGQDHTWDEGKWDDEYKLGGGLAKMRRGHRRLGVYADALLNRGSGGGSSGKFNQMAYKRLASHFDQTYVMQGTGGKFRFADFLRVMKGAQFNRIFVGSRGQPHIVSQPVQKAGNILARIIHDVHFIPEYPGQPKGKNYFYSIIHHLLKFMHLKRAQDTDNEQLFNHINSDPSVRTTLSKIILQYFYRVWRKWAELEHALSTSMINMDQKSRDAFNETFSKLGHMMEFQEIMKYIAGHVRFPNAKINVIDYPNATREQMRHLDKYRKNANLRPLWSKKYYLKELDSRYGKFLKLSKAENGKMKLTPEMVNQALSGIAKELKRAEWEYKYTGDSWFRNALLDRHGKMSDLASTIGILVNNDAKITNRPDGYVKEIGVKLSPDQRRKMVAEQERKRREEEEKRKMMEAARRRQRQKKLAERRERLVVQEQKNKMLEKMRSDEAKYQDVLQRLISGTRVSEADMRSLGKEVENVKQEAENKIQKLSREDREARLALIRGDNVSSKTLVELQTTASGLQTSLYDYIMEVRKIPTSSIVGVQTVPTGQQTIINTQNTDDVDLAS